MITSHSEEESEDSFIPKDHVADSLPTWLSTVQKVHPESSNSCKYKSPVLNDVTVYEMAREQQSQEFIAKFFSISRSTLLAHHKEAFEAGKVAGKAKIKRILMNIACDYQRKDQLRAVEIFMKQYMGLSDNPLVGRDEDGELETKTSYEIELIKPEDDE